MTTLRSAMADELDKRAQEFMSRHEVTYIQALRAVLPEENQMSKFTTPTAAGVEVGARVQRYVAQHQGVSYKEAYDAVLAADPELRTAYGQPSPRVARMAATDPRSEPAVPITPADEAAVQDWVMRAITDGKSASLPGALGSLAIEADKFAKIGMPVEESARRAMDLFPHLVSMARLLLTDLRRNAPENTPVAEAAQRSPGYVVHVRAQALQAKHPALDYRAAVGAVLSEDPALKAAYAGVQS